MVFNFRGFFQFTYRCLKSRRWNGRRVLVLGAFFVLFPVLETVIWIGFLLDNLFYRRHRKQPVSQPVFITGMFRSGTTFLHRLMAQDNDRFTTMAMWEILFTPSVSQRRFVYALAKPLKPPLSFLASRMEARWNQRNVMHRVSMREPEEDEYLLLHIWSSLTVGLSAGFLDEAMPYTYFDSQLPQRDRQRIMGFYRRCVQRYLFAHRTPQNIGYLAKNPALCPKLHTLYEFFPDAKIIYLVRNPLEVIPSFLSMMQFTWRVLGAPAEGSELRDYLLAMARHWYDYPLQYLDKMPDDSYVIVNYDELIRDPSDTVRKIYQRIGLPISMDFERVFQREADKARAYRSRHDYSLEKLGLDREQILEEFQDIFQRFGFDTEDH